ncbi:hypothetical protein M8J76_009639 [Diaphorina citri]|nr:hypothetical protein M8J76_009639 [Diaphorina citri]
MKKSKKKLHQDTDTDCFASKCHRAALKCQSIFCTQVPRECLLLYPSIHNGKHKIQSSTRALANSVMRKMLGWRKGRWRRKKEVESKEEMKKGKMEEEEEVEEKEEKEAMEKKKAKEEEEELEAKEEK